MGFDYEVKFSLDDCLKKLGLDEKGRVQRVVSNELLKNVTPFVPKDQGYLTGSGHVENCDEVVWKGPYARRLYYGEEDWNWSNGGVQEGGLRGPYWADRYCLNGGTEELEEAARKVVKK